MTATRFLMDENLSPELANVARRRGYYAMHIRDLGLLGVKDWTLLRFVLDGDWTLVTSNANEFRDRYRDRVRLHAGVVFLVDVDPGRDIQIAAFRAALSHIRARPDIVNQEILVRRRAASWMVTRRALPET
jgi:predicted nuclease of predicted toxin-antitoxin system